jgi:hypothetical protein
MENVLSNGRGCVVCLSGMLPSLVPYCLPSQFCFSALPVPRTLFLGGVGLKKSSFWGNCPPSEHQGTPLSSPPYTSPHSHALITVFAACFISSLTVLIILPALFPLLPPLFFCLLPDTCRLVSSFLLTLFSPHKMPFEAKVRVQALATLFDYGTEDSHGRTYSQKRKAERLGDYCIGVITRVYATRNNKPQRYTLKWDEMAESESHHQLPTG